MITGCVQNGEFVSRPRIGLSVFSKDAASARRKFNAHAVQRNDTNGRSMVRHIVRLSGTTDIAQVKVK